MSFLVTPEADSIIFFPLVSSNHTISNILNVILGCITKPSMSRNSANEGERYRPQYKLYSCYIFYVDFLTVALFLYCTIILLSIPRLADCKVTEEGLKDLAFGLKFPYLPLRELDLSNNDLKDSGVKLLCQGLSSPLCRLQILRYAMDFCLFLSSILFC